MDEDQIKREKSKKKGKREGKQTKDKKKKPDREKNEGDFPGIPTVEA